MKKLQHLFFLCLSFFSGLNFINAQSVSLTDIDSRGYNGVKSIPGKAFYFFHFGEKSATKGMANFTLELYDQSLNKISSIPIELSKSSELAGNCFNGQYFLFVFTDISHKTLSMITLDEKGAIVKKSVQEDVKRSLLDPDYYENILPAGDEDFVMVQPVREKKTGYAITRLDKDLQVKWTKEFTPETGSYEAMDCKTANGKVYVLRKDQKHAVGHSFETGIFCYDLATGNDVYSYKLYDGVFSCYPTVMDVDDQGNLTTGGMYFNGTTFDEANSDGLFFLALDPTGQKGKYRITPWTKVQSKMNGEFSSTLFGGKTKVLVEDIVGKPDGTYTIIAETFRKSNNANLTGNGALRMAMGGKPQTSGSEHEVGFTIMDFILFNYDKEGNLATLTKIEKPTRDIIIRGKMAQENGLSIALFMQEANMFCYRYIIEHNGKQYIVFKNNDGAKTKAYFMPLDATSTKGLAEIDLNKNISEGTNKLMKAGAMMNGDATIYDTGDFGTLKEDPEKWKNIVPGKPGSMLIYNYQNGKLNMWTEAIPD